jgi:hypothetical protein
MATTLPLPDCYRRLRLRQAQRNFAARVFKHYKAEAKYSYFKMTNQPAGNFNKLPYYQQSQFLAQQWKRRQFHIIALLLTFYKRKATKVVKFVVCLSGDNQCRQLRPVLG